MKLMLYVFTALLVGVSQAQASECIKESQPLLEFRGTLKEVKSLHSDGDQLSSVVIELEGEPFRFVDSSMDSPIQVQMARTVQLNLSCVSKAFQQMVYANIGKSVTVMGDFYIGRTASTELIVVNVGDMDAPE